MQLLMQETYSRYRIVYFFIYFYSSFLILLFGLHFALSFRQYFLFIYFDMTFYKYVSCSKQTIGLYDSFVYAKLLTLHYLLYGNHELSPTVIQQQKL
jgi:hypothetical protein